MEHRSRRGEVACPVITDLEEPFDWEAMRGEILETALDAGGSFQVKPVEVRPLPQDESWYETTWQAWREGKVFEK